MSCLDILSTYATSHYAQLYVLDDFVYHNRDHRQNMELYDQVKPPKVPLENVKNTKIILIQGSIDISSDQDDIKRLKNALTGKKYS